MHRGQWSNDHRPAGPPRDDRASGPERPRGRGELDRIAAIAASVSGADAGFVALETPARYALPGAFGLEALDVAREVADEAPLTDAIVRNAAPRSSTTRKPMTTSRGAAGHRSGASGRTRACRCVTCTATWSVRSASCRASPRDFDNTTVARLTEARGGLLRARGRPGDPRAAQARQAWREHGRPDQPRALDVQRGARCDRDDARRRKRRDRARARPGSTSPTAP